MLSLRIDIEFEGVAAANLPNGINAGKVAHLKGWPEFSFRNGKIALLLDSS